MRISPSILWLTLLTIGLGTFLIRFSFIWIFGEAKVHPRLQQILQYVPASVLSALVVPNLVFTQQDTISLANPRLWAGLVAALIAWRTRSVLLTIVSGMVVLWFLTGV